MKHQDDGKDSHRLNTVLQHFVTVKHIILHTVGLTEMEQRTEIGKTHILPIYHRQKCETNRGNVISSLPLPQSIVWLHLIVNNCWQNLRKPCSGPPPPQSPPSFPKSPSHHIIQKSLGGLHAWRAHTFLISYLALLGAVLWGNWADQSASTVRISTPTSHQM